MVLYKHMQTRVRDLARSQYSAHLVDALFDRPIFKITDVCQKTNIPKPTAHHLLKQLEDAKIIHTLRPSAGSRPAIFVFPELLAITEDTKSN